MKFRSLDNVFGALWRSHPIRLYDARTSKVILSREKCKYVVKYFHSHTFDPYSARSWSRWIAKRVVLDRVLSL